MGPVVRGTPNWKEYLEGAAPGDHILLLADNPTSTDRVLDAFARGGLRRGELVAFCVPTPEFAGLRASLRAMGHDLDVLVARQDIVIVAAEDWQPEDPADEEAVASFLEALLDLARASGKSGVSFVGRIAPSLFERGDVSSALLIEGSLHATRKTTRVLCPYDVRNLTIARIREMYPLLRYHTHSVTTLPEKQFLVETLPVADR